MPLVPVPGKSDAFFWPWVPAHMVHKLMQGYIHTDKHTYAYTDTHTCTHTNTVIHKWVFTKRKWQVCSSVVELFVNHGD